MSDLAGFLETLFSTGRVSVPLRAQAAAGTGRDGDTPRRLFPVSAVVAGPLLEFDAATATAAADVLRWACRFLVSRTEPPDQVEALVRMPMLPTSPRHTFRPT